MNTKILTGGLLAGLLAAGGTIGLASAQSTTAPVTLTAAQAIEIALDEVPGEFREAELEREGGKRIYEIEIRKADGVLVEVDVDAETGMVLDVEVENDDDHDDDDRDDDRDDDDDNDRS